MSEVGLFNDLVLLFFFMCDFSGIDSEVVW